MNQNTPGKNGFSDQPPCSGHNRPLRLMISGAGTGGHLFPGIAVAEELMQRLPGSRVMFVTTGRPVEKTVLAGQSFDTAQIPASGLKGMGLVQKGRSLLVLPRGVMRSLGLIRQFRPDAVLGMGGYSAAPVILAAFLRRVPRLVHEQNRLAGMTNQWLSRFANRVLVSFADTTIRCRPDKIHFTGHPVRQKIRQVAGRRAGRVPAEDQKPFTVAVLGGSQGARRINAAVIEAFSMVKEPGRFSVIHQTGVGDEEEVRRAYVRLDMAAAVSAFFRDMAPVYEASDLAVCRAGAATVAEIAAVGLPSLLIPYPYAADNHQVYNAGVLVDAGAAEMILEKDLNGSELANRFQAFADNVDGRFEKACRAARALGSPKAAPAVVDQILAAAGRRQAPAASNRQED